MSDVFSNFFYFLTCLESQGHSFDSSFLPALIVILPGPFAVSVFASPPPHPTLFFLLFCFRCWPILLPTSQKFISFCFFLFFPQRIVLLLVVFVWPLLCFLKRLGNNPSETRATCGHMALVIVVLGIQFHIRLHQHATWEIIRQKHVQHAAIWHW